MEEPSLSELFRSLKLPDKILVTVLTGLTLGGELLENLPTPRSVMRNFYTTQPPFKGVRKYSFERALERLLESKYLEKITEDRRVRYKITQEGLSRIYRRFPRLKISQKKFDGHFRIVVYDIAEAERRLRREIRIGLKKLGFRYLQRSVWISPYEWDEDLRDLFKKLRIGRDVFIFKSTLPLAETEDLLKAYWPELTA